MLTQEDLSACRVHLAKRSTYKAVVQHFALFEGYLGLKKHPGSGELVPTDRQTDRETDNDDRRTRPISLPLARQFAWDNNETLSHYTAYIWLNNCKGKASMWYLSMQ